MSETSEVFADLRRALTDVPRGGKVNILTSRLADPEPFLLPWLRSLVADRDESALSALWTADTPLHDIFQTMPDAEGPVTVRALRGLAALALTLVSAESREERLTAALVQIEASHLATPVVSAPFNPRPSFAALTEVLALLGRISDRHGPGVSAAASLLLHDLAEAFATPEFVCAVEALFDKGAEGQQASLRCHVLTGEPPGLYPHPRRMALFSTDVRFQTGLARAWHLAGGRRVRDAVVWSLEGADGPVHHVGDESMTAALTVVLDEVSRKRGRYRLVTALRQIKQDTAIIGGVDEQGRMVGVQGYPRKLQAARRTGIRVIVPRDDEQGARAVAGELDVELAADWKAAASKARSRDRRAMIRLSGVVSAMLAAVLVGVTLVGLTLYRTEQDQRREKAVEKLINNVSVTASRDPRLAVLLAAYAFKQHTSPRTQKLLLDALVTNAGLRRTIAANSHSGIRVAAAVASSATAGQSAPIVLTVDETDSLVAWDLDSGRSTDKRPHQGGIVSIAENPSVASTFATATADGHITFWRSDSQGKLKIISTLEIGGPRIRAAAFSPDGVTLALTGSDGILRFVDARDHRLNSLLRLPLDLYSSRDTTSLAFGVPTQSGSVPLYVGLADTVADASLMRVKVEHGMGVGAAPIDIGGHEGVLSVAFVRNDSYGFSPHTEKPGVLALGTGQGLQIWDPASRKDVVPFPAQGIAKPVSSVIATSTTVQAVTEDGVTELSANEEFATTATRPGSLAAGNVTIRDDGSIFVWTERQPLAGPGASDQLGLAGRQASFERDGRLLTTNAKLQGGDDQLTRADPRRPETSQPLPEPPAHRGLRLLDVTRGAGPELAVLIVPDRPAEITATDLSSSRSNKADLCSGTVTAATFAPAGNRLAVGCGNGDVLLLDARSLKEITRRELGPEPISALRFSADGATLVTGSVTETGPDYPAPLHFLNVRDLRNLASPVLYRGGITALAVDNGRIYSGGADGHVREWTAVGAPGKGDRYIGKTVGALAAAGGRVAASDGNRLFLMAGHQDGAELVPLTTVPLNAPSVVHMTFSPDASLLLTAVKPDEHTHDARTMGIWYVGNAELIPQACAAVGRELTAAEWKKYSDAKVSKPPLCASQRPSATPTVGVEQKEPPQLRATTGPAVASSRGDCVDLGPETSCGRIPGGYAWTISHQNPMTSQITFYRLAGGSWNPVVSTVGDISWQFASVEPASRQPGEPAYLVHLQTSASVGASDLTVVRNGQIVGHTAGTKIRIKVEQDGVHIWAPTYPGGVNGGIPQGYLRRLFAPGPDGTWTDGPSIPVPLDDYKP